MSSAPPSQGHGPQPDGATAGWDPSQPMISLHDVHKVYRLRDGSVVRALDGLSLDVPAGSIHGVVGTSGAGKSTLVRCLTALERPTSGEVSVAGQDMATLPPAALREARRRIRRVKEARFPRLKRLEDFDPTHIPDLPPATLAHLATGAWIDAGEPLVLLGDSGTGKSHLLIALGTAAAEQGRRVRYVTTAALVNELAEAAADHQLSRVVGRYARIDLLCLDEVGYVHLDPRGAELLFQIITEREERASIACASNAPFSEWGATFTDPRLAAAVVDRLTFNAHIINTGTTSYRLRATTAKKGAATT